MRKYSRPYGLIFISFILVMMISAGAAQSNSTEDSGKQVVKELDGATWIKSINWNPENSTQIELVVHSEIPKQISVQEIPDYNGRTGEFQPMQSVTLSTGDNKISVPVNGRASLGIAMVSSNNGIYVTHEPENYPDPGPEDAPFIALYAVGTTILSFSGHKKFSKWILKRGLIEE